MTESTSSQSATVNLDPTSQVHPIDASCRFSVLSLLSKGASWLVIAVFFEFINSIKLLFPEFLTSCPWVTYGVLDSAATIAFVFGFALQSGFGLLLWLQARLSGTPFKWTVYSMIGLGIWNIGVLASVLGVMAGHSTGFEGLSMPGYAACILFVGYLMIGGSALVHFHLRERGELYVSQWYGLGLWLWFPWILSIAILTLILQPSNGIMQVIAASWFARNLEMVCLVSIALAILYYVIPQSLGTNLNQRALAQFGFWSLFIVGGWGGLNQGAPVPSWYSGLHVVGEVAFLIPVAAIIASFCPLFKHRFSQIRSDKPLFLCVAALASLVLVALFDFITTCRVGSAFGELTLAHEAKMLVARYGIVALAIFAGVRVFLGKAVSCAQPSGNLTRLHLGGTLAGVAVLSVSFLISGILQSLVFYIPGAPFDYSVKYIKPFLALNILGFGLLVMAQLAYSVQLCRVWVYQYCGCCLPFGRGSRQEDLTVNNVNTVEA